MNTDRQHGDYVLLRRLAVGGQSEVFLAVKKGPSDYTRPVVIKALPPQAREDDRWIKMFYREAFISSRFSHPNVINVHDATLIDGEHCMMMDFISGQTVADIAQRGYKQQCPPTLKQVVQIIVDACDGLNYVHEFRDLDGRTYSVVHCDISPQNLMVTYSGVTMVFDFGIAAIIGFDEEDQPPPAGGKYAYMSPEQVAGEPVDPRSDIFSLGVILFELCTGYRLFRRDSPQEVIQAVLDDPIPLPRELKPEIPLFLEQIILRALERDPYKRYQSVLSMRSDLKQFLGMTTDSGGDLRRGLGAYIAGMFKDERQEIAQTLQQIIDPNRAVEQGDEESEGVLRQSETTMELQSPRNQIKASIEREKRDDKPAIEELKRRNQTLMLLVALLTFAAIALGFTLLNAAPEAEATVEKAP